MNENYFNKVAIVHERLDRRTLLEGLAEEAVELSQAALKSIRAEKMNHNVTPLDVVKAEKQLLEEIADVRCYLDVLGLTQNNLINVLAEIKMHRWIERLESDEKC
jgi:NTP pyrophosphatase (non-canonical NTP hydrolase)